MSANTIVTQHNKNTIYDSGKFTLNRCFSIFARVIPPAYDRDDKNKEHHTTISNPNLA